MKRTAEKATHCSFLLIFVIFIITILCKESVQLVAEAPTPSNHHHHDHRHGRTETVPIHISRHHNDQDKHPQMDSPIKPGVRDYREKDTHDFRQSKINESLTKNFGTYTAQQYPGTTTLNLYDNVLYCGKDTGAENPFKLLRFFMNTNNETLYYSCFRDGTFRIPLWVAHTLTKDMIDRPTKRQNKQTWDHWNPVTIAGNGHAMKPYDRGHLAPRGDFTSYPEKALCTFNVMNRAPQAAKFNEDGWDHLEGKVRDYVLSQDSNRIFYVITGVAYPLYNSSSNITYHTMRETGDDGQELVIPDYYWKVLYDVQKSVAVYFYDDNTEHVKELSALYDLPPSNTVIGSVLDAAGFNDHSSSSAKWNFSSSFAKEFNELQ